jgi:hypothetical protein
MRPPRPAKSFPDTSGMTLRGRPLYGICSNDGRFGSESGNVLFCTRGLFGNGFIAAGEVRYETSCKHLDKIRLCSINDWNKSLFKIISALGPTFGVTIG